MYSLSNRFSSAVSIFSTALTISVLLLSYLSYSSLQSIPRDYFDEYTKFEITDMKLASKKLRSYGGTSGKPKENAKFKFDLQMDFTPLIDCNTKQIYTYIYLDLEEKVNNPIDSIFNNGTVDNDHEVKYGTRVLGGNFPDIENESKLIIWDHIFTGHSAHLVEKGIKSKYSIWDYSPKLNGRKGNFKLAYNIQPHVGPLLFGEIDLHESVTLL